MNNTIAAIDIGTNSFHLVIVRIDDRKRFTVLTKAKEVVRLGAGSNDMKYISDESMKRGVETLKRFYLICKSYNAEIIAIATSATREALNRDIFLSKVFNETGIEINIVSGYEEARLIYLGVLQSLNIYNKKILLIDIGGGSTEFLIGEKGQVISAVSTKIGAVRLTHKFFHEEKTDKVNLKNARQFVKGALSPVIRSIENVNYDMVIGSSGTIINIGSIISSENLPADDYEFNLNGFVIKKKQLFNAVETIYRAETKNERISIPGLDPKRADIITAGAVILEQIFTDLKIDKMTLSGYALREGIIMNYVQQISDEYSTEHLKNVRFNSAVHLGEQSNFDKEHAFKVMKISGRIFDFIKLKFGLTDDEREYLEVASLLHDIGYYISHTDHHKHSYYLIRHSEMLGFNFKEIEIIANIARYHRKSHPKLKHENFVKLDQQSQALVRKLSGILRIADALDRSHKSLVNDIEININQNVFEISLKSVNSDPSLELWGVNVRKGLFEESFGCEVKIKNVS